MELLSQNHAALRDFRNEIETRSGKETALVINHALNTFDIYALRNGKPHSIMAVIGRGGVKTGIIYTPKSTYAHGSAQGSIFSEPNDTLTDGGRVHYVNRKTPSVQVEYGEL